MPSYNFFLPYAPCSPGFIFKAPGATFQPGIAKIGTSLSSLPEGGIAIRTVFVQLARKRWLYVGEYRVRKMEPLREWPELAEKVGCFHENSI
jgi:hypothetical protein